LIFQYVNAEQKYLIKLINYVKILLNQLDFSQVISLHFIILAALLHLLDHSIQSAVEIETVA